MDALNVLHQLEARAAAGDAEAKLFLPVFAAWMVARLAERRRKRGRAA